MLKFLPALIAFCLVTPAALAEPPRVWLDTDRGPILLELDPERAPDHVENFLAYVNDGFYDGLIFHRSIEGFVVQGGGYDQEFRLRQPTRGPIPGRPDNGLPNDLGSIAMAQIGGNINSAQTQFYINTGRNTFLDAEFTVFGRVVAGLSVVQDMNGDRGLTTFVGNSRFDDVPVRPPLIRRAVETRGFPVMPLHTGSWYDPATAGTGFNIEVANDATSDRGPRLVVYWYDFRTGEKLWATGSRSFSFGASEVTVQLLAVDTPADVDFRLPPDFEAFETWGSVTVSFSGCNSAVVDYDTVAQGSGRIELTRLTIPDQFSCLEFD